MEKDNKNAWIGPAFGVLRDGIEIYRKQLESNSKENEQKRQQARKERERMREKERKDRELEAKKQKINDELRAIRWEAERQAIRERQERERQERIREEMEEEEKLREKELKPWTDAREQLRKGDIQEIGKRLGLRPTTLSKAFGKNNTGSRNDHRVLQEALKIIREREK